MAERATDLRHLPSAFVKFVGLWPRWGVNIGIKTLVPHYVFYKLYYLLVYVVASKGAIGGNLIAWQKEYHNMALVKPEVRDER